MPSCPVCEHTQSAWGACEVCGWALSEPGAPPPAADPAPLLEGLERTALVEPDGPAGLDLPPMDLLAAEPDGPSALPAVPEPPIELVPDLEPTRAERGAPTPRAEVATCRYCRMPVPAGAAFCDTCGMRAPRTRPAQTPDAPAETWRCPVCFARAEGAQCGACGARAPGMEP